jgi:hypothetical protein
LVAAIAAELAKAKPDEVVHVPFGADDVGGEMVAIASEGLYADPRDALREYVQNSVDAGAQNVDVVLGASSAKVEDDGGGMTLEALLRARQFAKSSKSSLSSVGFRGIGIYAGFPMCDRLRLETQLPGEKIGHTLTFDFKWMRERLLAERTARAGTERTSLPKLMTEGTSVATHRVMPSENGKTTVHLDGLSAHAITELADFEQLRQYLINTLPVGYEEFAGRAAVEAFLGENVPGYRTVNVTLKSEVTKAEKAVTREYPSDLGAPVFLKADDPEGEPHTRAVIWAAVSDPQNSKHPATGLLYKSRGFTIGDQDRTRRLFLTRQTVVNWMVGEIWVTDPTVTPNAARNDFEATQPKRRLEAALATSINALKNIVVFDWEVKRAVKVYDDIDAALPAVELAVFEGDFEAFNDARYKFFSLERSFSTQRFKEKLPSLSAVTSASSETLRSKFASAVESLVARREVMRARFADLKVALEARFRPTEEAEAGGERDKEQTTQEPEAAEASGTDAEAGDGTETRGGTAAESNSGESGGAGAPDQASGNQPPAEPADDSQQEQLTLIGVLTDAGTTVPKSFRLGLAALQSAFEDALSPSQRNAVLAALRRRLGGH